MVYNFSFLGKIIRRNKHFTCHLIIINCKYSLKHILTPTRGRCTNDPSLLDLLFTSIEENIEIIQMHATLGKSDHSMIKVLYRTQPENPEMIVCNYAKVDFQKMKEKLDIDCGTSFNECKDGIDMRWEMYMNNFDQIERECVPKRIVKTGERKFSYPLERKALAKHKKKYRWWKRFMETKSVCQALLVRLWNRSSKTPFWAVSRQTQYWQTNNLVCWGVDPRCYIY